MNRTLSLIISLLSLLLFAPQVLSSERAEQGWKLIEQGALIVDVRTPAEFADGHIEGAVNYPLSQVEQHFANIAKNQVIVLYCRSGNRSGQAFHFLQSKGFTQLHNAGGLTEMRSAQD